MNNPKGLRRISGTEHEPYSEVESSESINVHAALTRPELLSNTEQF